MEKLYITTFWMLVGLSLCVRLDSNDVTANSIVALLLLLACWLLLAGCCLSLAGCCMMQARKHATLERLACARCYRTTSTGTCMIRQDDANASIQSLHPSITTTKNITSKLNVVNKLVIITIIFLSREGTHFNLTLPS